MKTAMLTMEQYDNRKENSVGSSRIRGRWVMKYDPRIEPFKHGIHYDAIIYQKSYWKEHMERYPGIKIFDICDPDWMEGRPIREVCEMVDAITVPTKPLKDFISQLTEKPVVVIPDRIDPEEHTPIKEKHAGRARSVVWFGYSTNQVVLDQTVNILQKMQLQLVVISDRGYRDADVNVPWNYDTINEEIVKHDIVIMPDYKQDLRHRFKSDNKTLTSWALRMPVATSPEQMEQFLDGQAREKEAEMRYNHVMTNCHAKLSGPEYMTLIESIKAQKEKEVSENAK